MTLNLASPLKEGAQLHPQRTALIHGDRRWAWRRFAEEASRIAGALQGRGLQRGQHIALMVPNIPEFTLAYYGLQWAGLVAVPLNVLLTAEEVAQHLEDSQAVALIAASPFLAAARAGFQQTATCEHLVVVGEAPADGELPLEALIRSGPALEDTAATGPEDTAVILYTSGTTGRPKGAELSQFNLFYNADYCRTTLLPLHEEAPVGLMTLPLFHSFGQTVLQNRYVQEGGTLVYLPRFEPAHCLRLLVEHKVSVFAGVPTMYFELLHHPGDGPQQLPDLRYAVSGGAPMPVEILREFERRHSIQLLEGYGLSETSPVASFNVLERVRKPGSIGIPIRGVEFQLRDEQGERIDRTGVPGEIWIKGHNVMKGYWRQPEATRESLVEGWFATGDVATVDQDGDYFIVDRKKDMILRGGFNVYPREIEEVLYAHPAVAEAAVVGVPHPSLGEEVLAAVVLRPGQELSEGELIEYCKLHLAAYKYPRRFLFRSTLPRGATGKILKRRLRREIEES